MGSEDVTTRLLAAIEETERDALWAAHPGQWASWESIANPLAVGLDGKTRLERMAAATLRRCAADRKIVELHEPDDEKGAFDFGRFRNVCTTCGHAVSDGDWVGGFYPCDTILALAAGYDLTTEEAPDEHHDH